MSTIIFEGNTYTFGATVSANPGTGTTSYVFGGLTPGSTYGFIVWAFNGFGPSNIVGPTTKITLSETPEEIRPDIYVFQGLIDQGPLDTYNYYDSTDSINLMPDSTNLQANWSYLNLIKGIIGITLPTGYTDGIGFVSTSTFVRLDSFVTGNLIQTGATYIFSFYHNVSAGATTTSINLYLSPNTYGNNSTTIQQFLPVTGPSYLANTGTPRGLVYQTGATGWQRFAFYINIQKPVVENLSILTYPGIGSAGITWYFSAPQLELMG